MSNIDKAWGEGHAQGHAQGWSEGHEAGIAKGRADALRGVMGEIDKRLLNRCVWKKRQSWCGTIGCTCNHLEWLKEWVENIVWKDEEEALAQKPQNSHKKPVPVDHKKLSEFADKIIAEYEKPGSELDSLAQKDKTDE